jgi:hypothetical protein
MRKGVEVRLGPGDRELLEAVIRLGEQPAEACVAGSDRAAERRWGRNDGDPATDRQRQAEWQAHLMTEGVDGLLHEATRPAGKPPLTPAVIERVDEMTLAEPPGERTHWTGRAMAKAAGVSHRSVQPIWAAHGLKPHRVRTFKLSNDPKSSAKVQDVSASMLTRQSTRWGCRSMRSRRSRRSTAPSQGCQLRRAAAGR